MTGSQWYPDMKKAVIFDLDDTLISEDEYIRSGYRAVASHISKKLCPEKTGDEIYGELISLFNEDHKNVPRLVSSQVNSFTGL